MIENLKKFFDGFAGDFIKETRTKEDRFFFILNTLLHSLFWSGVGVIFYTFYCSSGYIAFVVLAIFLLLYFWVQIGEKK